MKVSELTGALAMLGVRVARLEESRAVRRPAVFDIGDEPETPSASQTPRDSVKLVSACLEELVADSVPWEPAAQPSHAAVAPSAILAALMRSAPGREPQALAIAVVPGTRVGVASLLPLLSATGTGHPVQPSSRVGWEPRRGDGKAQST